MMTKKIALSLLTVVLSLILVQCNRFDRADSDLPNIILCMADDQGWGDMGYMGHPVIQTPNLDAMAGEALRFDRFYAAAPVCSPTRGSVLTGRHPNRFGCFSWGLPLRPQEITIAEVLKEAGYVTGHFGKWHLGSVQQGSPVNPGTSGFDEWFSSPNFFDNDPILSREGIAKQTRGESSMVTVEAALEFIQKYDGKERPWLAVIWFGSPHKPHEAAEEDRRIYDDQPEALQHFYGEITGIDRAFGKLRSALKQLDGYENTILWYCSDNGGLKEFGSNGGRGHKGDIYEGGLKVPALLEWPAKITGSRITHIPANTSDIFPTLLDITGIKADSNLPLDGISLLPVILGESDTRSEPMGFWRYTSKGMVTPSAEWMSELLEAQKNGAMVADSSHLRFDDIRITQYPADSLPGHAAWLDWPWKLHRKVNKMGEIIWELYKLDLDSMEQHNLVMEQSERLISMKASLARWQLSVVNSLNGKDYPEY